MSLLNSNEEYIIEDDKELTSLLDEWQQRLKLQPWNIRARIAKEKDMELQGVGGECHWTLENRTALINLLRHEDYANELFAHDMEQILVHELLHLHFAPFFKNKVEQEQLIDLMASVLVGLKRKK